MTTYDEIHAVAAKLEPPTQRGHLNVDWVLPARLAIGRDCENRHLLVLGGPAVTATSESVQRALMTGSWASESSGDIEGTVLRLHAGDEFMVAATTIAVELLRRGLSSRPTVDVFGEVEGFIELVIRRVLLPHEALLGLVGELLVLDRGGGARDAHRPRAAPAAAAPPRARPAPRRTPAPAGRCS